MAAIPRLELIANEVIMAFEIKAPPIPIESMLQHPKPDMWEDLNPNQITSGFVISKGPYTTRMSLARYLARHILDSAWGEKHDIGLAIQSNDDIRAFARMLIMPLPMVKALSEDARAPAMMSHHFEVPEADAQQRLIELADYL